MEDHIECGGFVFIHDFDSGNLGHVEQVPKEDIVSGVNLKTNIIETPDYEFNIWTRPDCFSTEFENGNRTWFYFGIKSAPSSVLVKLNLVNLNKQSKMYSQGMAPVTKTIPGKLHWERIKDKPVFHSDENIFTLSFKFQTPENSMCTTYFAFTYPYTYMELQNHLDAIDAKVAKFSVGNDDDIYYHRECVCYSLEKRRVDLLTITSQHGKMNDRELKLKHLFPDNEDRPFRFTNKKVIFISARVHPGETPSSFVFNGFLNLLLNRHDPVALTLRKLYVFKMIPFMNPDGVAKGHYRTDTRGVNLNRVYQAPSFEYHPSVFAARALIRYYHFGFEKEDNTYESSDNKFDFNAFEDPSKTANNTKLNQENLSSNLLSNKFKTSSPLLKKRWQNPNEQKFNSSHIPKMKLAIDSEDDTSCSMSTNNTTLAEQVEDLNINQCSVDRFSIIPSDNECAIDNVIDKSNYSFLSNALDADDLSVDSKITFAENNDSTKQIIETNDQKDDLENQNLADLSGKEKSSTQLSMSACFRLNQMWCKACKIAVKDLESKMPGISQMIPSICNNEDFANKNQSKDDLICVNCRLPIDAEGQIITPTLNLNLSLITSTSVTSNITTTTPVATTTNNNVVPDTETSDLNDINLSPIRNAKNVKSKSSDKPAPKKLKSLTVFGKNTQKEKESNLFLYIDLHGHASKKGIFMYGNHFEEIDSSVECMLLPRIMSLNNMHFHFSSCNFTERNMYLKDRRDGMSREGSGRVAVLKATGLMRSYTLECNYNTGRTVNILPSTVKESLSGHIPNSYPATPPKYTPHLFEEVGKSLGPSILDLTGSHPNSRIPSSEHRNLHGIREWLRLHSRQVKTSQVVGARQSASACTLRTNTSRAHRSHIRTSKQQNFADTERKENLAGPMFQVESRIASSRIGMTSNARPSTSMKSLNRLKDQPLSSKTQRNISLISIKKPTTSKHPSAFKTPSRSKSPGSKLRFSTKQKLVEEPDLIKGAIRGLAESNRGSSTKQAFKTKAIKGNFKCHKDNAIPKQCADMASSSLAHRKTKVRSKEVLYPKQASQFTTKPLSKRLKVSQYIKYSDNAKEKYRIRKPTNDTVNVEGVSSSVSSSGEDVLISWDALCGIAGSSGNVPNSPSVTKQKTQYKSRRHILHHIPSAANDLGNVRHKFV